MAEVVEEWLNDFVARPTAQVGREGDVCPCMRAGLDADAVEVRVRDNEDCLDGGRLCALAEEEMDRFLAGPGSETAPGRALAGVVVALPRASHGGWAMLDRTYPQLKELAVARGLMVAQFHPDCDVRAIRNPRFRVAQAPVALLAIRRMARHDVLFLNERADWYRAYERRFGSGPAVRNPDVDPLMYRAWQRARARIGSPEGSDKGSG